MLESTFQQDIYAQPQQDISVQTSTGFVPIITQAIAPRTNDIAEVRLRQVLARESAFVVPASVSVGRLRKNFGDVVGEPYVGVHGRLWDQAVRAAVRFQEGSVIRRRIARTPRETHERVQHPPLCGGRKPRHPECL